MPTEPMPWPEALRALLQATGETERAFAARLDVAPSTVHRWLRAGVPPRGRNRRALKRLLREQGITVQEDADD